MRTLEGKTMKTVTVYMTKATESTKIENVSACDFLDGWLVVVHAKGTQRFRESQVDRVIETHE